MENSPTTLRRESVAHSGTGVNLWLLKKRVSQFFHKSSFAVSGAE